MRIENLSVEAALAAASKMTYAYIAFFDRLYLGKVEANCIDAETILKARFFDQATEIRLYREEGILKAVAYMLEEGDAYIERRIPVLKHFGTAITKREYLKNDDDGQMNIIAVCLCGWEE